MKRIMLLMACLFTINLFGYTIKVHNKTDGQIKVNITFSGKGVCSDSNFFVNRGQTKPEEVGGCCSEWVRVTPVSGSAPKKQVVFEPPLTGYGISCRSYDVYVTQLADKTLNISATE